MYDISPPILRTPPPSPFPRDASPGVHPLMAALLLHGYMGGGRRGGGLFDLPPSGGFGGGHVGPQPGGDLGGLIGFPGLAPAPQPGPYAPQPYSPYAPQPYAPQPGAPSILDVLARHLGQRRPRAY